MSATGRNRVGSERHADDFYETPDWVIRVAVNALPFKRGTVVLDPCAGTGAILRWVPGVAKVMGIEIDYERSRKCNDVATCLHADALHTQAGWRDANMVITNPPYKLAMEFITKAIQKVDIVAMLLRLNFLGSQKRAAFHTAYPAHLIVLPKRPSFTEDGKTDATEYAWYIWGDHKEGTWEMASL